MGQHALLENKQLEREQMRILYKASEWFIATCMWDGSCKDFKIWKNKSIFPLIPSPPKASTLALPGK